MAKRAEGVQKAIAYFLLYKGTYPLETLKQQLRKNGYTDDIIEEAARQVFVGGSQSQAQEGGGFFSIRHRREYASGGSKFLDFTVGFFGLPLATGFVGIIVGFILNMLGVNLLYGFGIGSLLFVYGGLYLVLPIAGIVYFWKRRRFLARGIFACFIFLPFIYIFIGGGYYFLRYFF